MPPPEMPPGPPVPDRGKPPTPDQVGPAVPEPLVDEAPRRRRGVLAGVAALGAVALLAGVLVLRGGDDPERSAEAPAATAPPTPGPPATTDQFEELVVELSAFVEAERDLEFLEPVATEFLPGGEFEDRVRQSFEEDIDEEREDLAAAAGAYQALGLWPPGADVVDVLVALFTGGTLGFYDPEEGELVVRGDQVTPLLRIVLVHELTHALDDQHHDLERPELSDQDDEASFAFSALVEGSAGRVEDAYRETLTDEEQAQAFAEESGLAAGMDLTTIPPVLLVELDFIYRVGAEFVAVVHDAGGNAALDQAFEDPPTTTEQILRPEAYLSGEDATEVAAPPADGEVVDEGVAGQFVLDLLIDGRLGSDVPAWDGDRYVLWEDGDGWCIRIAVEGDVEGIVDALGPWAGSGGEVTVEDDRAVLTGCG